MNDHEIQLEAKRQIHDAYIEDLHARIRYLEGDKATLKEEVTRQAKANLRLLAVMKVALYEMKQGHGTRETVKMMEDAMREAGPSSLLVEEKRRDATDKIEEG